MNGWIHSTRRSVSKESTDNVQQHRKKERDGEGDRKRHVAAVEPNAGQQVGQRERRFDKVQRKPDAVQHRRGNRGSVQVEGFAEQQSEHRPLEHAVPCSRCRIHDRRVSDQVGDCADQRKASGGDGQPKAGLSILEEVFHMCILH